MANFKKVTAPDIDPSINAKYFNEYLNYFLDELLRDKIKQQASQAFGQQKEVESAVIRLDNLYVDLSKKFIYSQGKSQKAREQYFQKIDALLAANLYILPRDFEPDPSHSQKIRVLLEQKQSVQGNTKEFKQAYDRLVSSQAHRNFIAKHGTKDDVAEGISIGAALVAVGCSIALIAGALTGPIGIAVAITAVSVLAITYGSLFARIGAYLGITHKEEKGIKKNQQESDVRPSTVTNRLIDELYPKKKAVNNAIHTIVRSPKARQGYRPPNQPRGKVVQLRAARGTRQPAASFEDKQHQQDHTPRGPGHRS